MSFTLLTWDWFQAAVALAFQLWALVIWFRLYGHIRFWSFWTCFFGIVVTMSHRIAEIRGIFWYGHTTAVFVSATYTFAAWMALRAVTADEARDKQMKLLQENQQRLQRQAEEQKGAATALAVILTDFKARISFYEKQAADHGLPLFVPDSSATVSDQRADI